MSDKKKRPKSKAAQVTQARREARQAERPAPAARTAAPQVSVAPREAVPDRFRSDVPESVEYKGGGMLTGMRGGFQSVVGGGGRKKGWTGTIVYALLLMALAAFIWGTAR